MQKNIKKPDGRDEVIDFIASTVHEHADRLMESVSKIKAGVAQDNLRQAIGMCSVLALGTAEIKGRSALRALARVVNTQLKAAGHPS